MYLSVCIILYNTVSYIHLLIDFKQSKLRVIISSNKNNNKNIDKTILKTQQAS